MKGSTENKTVDSDWWRLNYKLNKGLFKKNSYTVKNALWNKWFLFYNLNYVLPHTCIFNVHFVSIHEYLILKFINIAFNLKFNNLFILVYHFSVVKLSPKIKVTHED